MINIKLSSINAHPSEIFKALEDRRAEIEWGNSENDEYIPKYEKPTKVKFTAGIYNFIRGVLTDLRP